MGIVGMQIFGDRRTQGVCMAEDFQPREQQYVAQTRGGRQNERERTSEQAINMKSNKKWRKRSKS
jgi:hypothetical protein